MRITCTKKQEQIYFGEYLLSFGSEYFISLPLVHYPEDCNSYKLNFTCLILTLNLVIQPEVT
jgi:hypothetical protein